jgi:hypothetical protein
MFGSMLDSDADGVSPEAATVNADMVYEAYNAPEESPPRSRPRLMEARDSSAANAKVTLCVTGLARLFLSCENLLQCRG